MRILVCAYRNWAKSVYNDLRNHMHSQDIQLVETPEGLVERAKESWDVIAVIGWSWLVPADIINKHLVIGMHPSDLPSFAGGSPIQNQIIAGLEESKATLFKLNEKFDQGEIIDKEPISLRHHLNDVLFSISHATTTLMMRFIRNFPNNEYLPQEGERSTVKRLKPTESKLGSIYGTNIFKPPMTAKEVWNFIRCREDPYPNAYIEDETGRLTFKLVEFEEKK